MARNILFIVFFVLFSISSSFAQDPVCEPDPAYADSLAGVYPGPYHPVDYPDGGIHDTACINHPFELVLTAVIRDSIDYEGLKFVQ